METKEKSKTLDISQGDPEVEFTPAERINHPSHYTWLKEKCGVEVIDIARHLDFNTGNALKYLLRAGYKHEAGYTERQKAVEDLRKAVWYINDKIEHLTGEA